MINVFLIPTFILAIIFFGLLVPIRKQKDRVGSLRPSFNKSPQEEIYKPVIRPIPEIKSPTPKTNFDSDLDVDGARMVMTMTGSISTSSVVAGINISTYAEALHRDTLNTGDQLWGVYVVEPIKKDGNNRGGELS